MTEIRFGGALCEMRADLSSTTHLSCQIGNTNTANASLLASNPVRMEALHREIGYALIVGTSNSSGNYFALQPRINSSNMPQTSGILGGGILNILGSGFEPDRLDPVNVTLGTDKYPCRSTSISSGQITCIVDLAGSNFSSFVNSSNVAIDVQIFDSRMLKWIPVFCESTANCTYTFDIEQTPKVTLIDPLEITGPSAVLQITGDKLLLNNESKFDLSILVGGVDCINITQIEESQNFTCTLSSQLPYGIHSVTAVNRFRGNANISTNLAFASLLEVDSVSLSFDSFAGGTPICLTGNGLDAPNITSYFGNSNCTFDSGLYRTSNQLCCSTSEHILPTDGESTTIVNLTAHFRFFQLFATRECIHLFNRLYARNHWCS